MSILNFHRANKNLVNTREKNKAGQTAYELLQNRMLQRNPFDPNLKEISFIAERFLPKTKK